jgi:UDP-N-acetylglucosamine 3-dehydrogenase
MTRIGIIGVGLMGERHAQHWHDINVEIAGYYDVDQKKSRQMVDRFGGRVFDRLSDLARTSDIVQICTPPAYHKEAVVSALEFHRPIFCEKPLALDYAEARDIVDMCRKVGVPLFVGHVLRFFHQYRTAKELIAEGSIGNVRSIYLTRAAGHPMNFDKREWFRSIGNTGGAVMEGGVHDLDFARWCAGEVDRVFARGITYRETFDRAADHSLVMLRFKNGAIGHIEASWMLTDGSFRQQFEITGTEGILEYDSSPASQLVITSHNDETGSGLPQEIIDKRDDPYTVELQHFLACLDTDTEFIVTPEDALAALRLSLAAHKSMRSGRMVRVEEIV